jgi:uncharacterized protein (TIGR03083 family)
VEFARSQGGRLRCETTTTMDGSDYLNAIGRESDAFSRAARQDLTAAVPSCPDWAIADLVEHLGGVQSWVAGGIEAKSLVEFERAPGRSGDLIDWFDRGVNRLIKALENAGTDMPVWTITQAEGSTGLSLWWYRRQAHEAAIHRWDAQTATGIAAAIDRVQALDGIEEFFEVALPHVVTSHPSAFRGTLELAPTDSSVGWVIDFLDGRAQARRSAGERSQTKLRGTASTLLLWLWNRPVGAELKIDGDEALPERWRELVRF